MSTQNKELNVGNVMLLPEKFPVVKENAIVKEALEKMDAFRLGIVCITDNDEQLLGIITDGDIRRLLKREQKIENIFASDFMTKKPKILHVNTLAYDALIHMKKNSISQVLVKSDDINYIGVVHILDIIKQGINNE